MLGSVLTYIPWKSVGLHLAAAGFTKEGGSLKGFFDALGVVQGSLLQRGVSCAARSLLRSLLNTVYPLSTLYMVWRTQMA